MGIGLALGLQLFHLGTTYGVFNAHRSGEPVNFMLELQLAHQCVRRVCKPRKFALQNPKNNTDAELFSGADAMAVDKKSLSNLIHYSEVNGDDRLKKWSSCPM